VTFRLYGWGNASTADSNTTSFGRVNGPRVRGTVVTPVLLQAPAVGPGNFHFNLTGLAATSYYILRAPAITGPWTTNGTVLTDGGGAGSHTDSSPLADGAFYRAYLP
jgi:hypothetical protein